MAHEEQTSGASKELLASTKNAKGSADDSGKGTKEGTESYEDKENPFSLLYQPPSKFSPRPLEDIAQLSSRPSPVDSGPSLGSSEHSLASSEPSFGSSAFANYWKKFQNQPVCDQVLTMSLSREQPISNQATQYDVSGFPIAAPLCNLESVVTWEYGQDELCVATVPLQERFPDPFESNNLIVCHDMMGGYLDDRFVQGNSNTEGYFLYHWQHISAFIYFSHHFVSIPPPSWTNAAHRHGVRVLGTVITEWQEGAKICARLLHQDKIVHRFVQQLISIAQYYRFDGWLVNIENPIHHSYVDSLYLLLTLLTTGMHQAIPGSKVIWYDSVTNTGDLTYQNALNEKNESFFSICDGIFLNYAWTEDKLRQSSREAGTEAPKVFVGIDVFGRGCFGGGGYNTNLALQVIRAHGLSAALFAPGWVYENQDRENFFEHQTKFWTLLAPFCTTYPISSLPIVSSFSRGFGKHVTIDGEVVFKGRWNNLSAQDIQPSFTDCLYKNDPTASVKIHTVELDHSISYNNGSSLFLSGSISGPLTPTTCPTNVRLFRVNKVQFSKPVLVSYTYHSKCDSLKHVLRLRTSSSPKYVLLDPAANFAGKKSISNNLPSLQPIETPTFTLDPKQNKVLGPLSDSSANTLHYVFTGHDIAESDSFGWKTSYFVLALAGAGTLQGISISLYPSDACPSEETGFAFHLGEIKLFDAKCVSTESMPSIIYSLECMDMHFNKHKSALSLTLSWQRGDSQLDPIDHCNVFASIMDKSVVCHPLEMKSEAKFVFLGRAYSNCFRVVDFALPFVSASNGDDSNSVMLEFRVQPVTVSRQKLAVSLTHKLQIQLSE